MSSPPSWWDYQSRKQRKEEVTIAVPKPEPMEVKETPLSDTAITRVAQKFRDVWARNRGK